jgi:hypothetical protein
MSPFAREVWFNFLAKVQVQVRSRNMKVTDAV